MMQAHSQPGGIDLEAFMQQLMALRSNDELRFNSYSQSIDARFRTLHEDGRRDRREVLEKLDRVAAVMQRDMRAGLVAIERRLKDVCDKGGEEHQQFRDHILLLTRRMDDAEARAHGRGQVLGWLGVAGTWMLDRGWKPVIMIAAIAGAAKLYLPEARDVEFAPTAHASDALPALELRLD